jgi:hypothetical protein
MGTSEGTKPAAKPAATSGGAVGKAAGIPGRFGKSLGKIKLIVFLVVALAVFIAAQAGFIGYGFAELKSTLFPRDEGLLAYVPGTSAGVVIIDPHQLELASLGDEQSSARAALEQKRKEIKTATDIDIAFDVDKLLIAPEIAVARGRFSQDKLEERLIANGYVVSEHKGIRYLFRKDEDAVAVRGSILLYGDEAELKAAIDAEDADTSLAQNEDIKRRLSQMGWDHAVLATARTDNERPSLRAIITGASGPRAFTAAAVTKGGGLTLKVNIETASAAAVDELAKLLEEKRGNIETLKGVLGPDLTPLLADIAKATTITPAPATSAVKLEVALDAPTLDRLIKGVSAVLPASGSELYKNLRLYQLLVPGL